MLRRTTASLVLVTACLAVVASSVAEARRSGVRFVSASKTTFPGERAFASVSTRSSAARCSLSVTYASGAKQAGLRPTQVAGRRATWEWQVPEDTRAGTARLTATCGRAGRATRTISVVGSLVPARIAVVQTGFSLRPNTTRGSKASYGVVLENTSPNQDAHNVTVLVNLVGADNYAWGSSVTRVDGIAASSKYFLGNSMSFDGVPPVARLEVVVQIGGRAPATRRPATLGVIPALRNILIEPNLFEPQWVGAVSGEMVNNSPALILESANLSTVVFDAGGNIIGGGTGYSFISLIPSARAVFKATSGFDAIPMIQAASAITSVTPRYRQPGS